MPAETTEKKKTAQQSFSNKSGPKADHFICRIYSNITIYMNVILSNFTTASTISLPKLALTIQTMEKPTKEIGHFHKIYLTSLKWYRLDTSLWDCCMSPCKARAPGNNPESWEAESFVSVNIIVRPPLNQTLTGKADLEIGTHDIIQEESLKLIELRCQWQTCCNIGLCQG